MINAAPLVDIEFRVLCHHPAGETVPMARVRDPHDPAEIDPERHWTGRRSLLYRCPSCQYEVSVEPATPDQGLSMIADRTLVGAR